MRPARGAETTTTSRTRGRAWQKGMVPPRQRVVGLGVLGLLTVVGAFALGRGTARAANDPRHPALLTGADWAMYGPREKDAYLSGFIAGAAAAQVRALAVAAGDSSDSSAVSSGAIERLRRAHALRYSYAPSVYTAELDDFYWWANHRDVPIVDVIIAITRRVKGP